MSLQYAAPDTEALRRRARTMSTRFAIVALKIAAKLFVCACWSLAYVIAAGVILTYIILHILVYGICVGLIHCGFAGFTVPMAVGLHVTWTTLRPERWPIPLSVIWKHYNGVSPYGAFVLGGVVGGVCGLMISLAGMGRWEPLDSRFTRAMRAFVHGRDKSTRAKTIFPTVKPHIHMAFIHIIIAIFQLPVGLTIARMRGVRAPYAVTRNETRATICSAIANIVFAVVYAVYLRSRETKRTKPHVKYRSNPHCNGEKLNGKGTKSKLQSVFTYIITPTLKDPSIHFLA